MSTAHIYVCPNFTIFAKYIENMGKIISSKSTRIVTSDGIQLVRRVTIVQMPNGKYRYPVDYYDASPEPIELTKDKLDRIRVHVYKQLI